MAAMIWNITDEKGTLIFILCGDHGQLVPLEELKESLVDIKIYLQTRRALTMTVVAEASCTKAESISSYFTLLIRMHFSKILTGYVEQLKPEKNALFEKASKIVGCFANDSHVRGIACLPQTNSIQTTPMSSSTTRSGIFHDMPPNKPIAQQIIASDEVLPHTTIAKPCFPDLERPSVDAKTSSKPLYPQIPHCVTGCIRTFSRSDKLRNHYIGVHGKY
ncbi:hypothetical protein N7455_004118 [Penicillium solitum]|uniref:uncharacterized protein n=1 Tax=Penicillium solitum TaxID=60172 RepID=UPI0032C452AE|nr:hypothetical protein N7455_004118 [Penicillium solitum]